MKIFKYIGIAILICVIFSLGPIAWVIAIIVCVIKASGADKRSDKEKAEIAEKVATLPDMSFVAKEMTSAQKAAYLWPGDKDLLQVFKYDSDTQTIYMEMKDGRSVNCLLSELRVDFGKVNSLYRIEIHHESVKFSFYKYSFVFTNDEWDCILNTLLLAGTTSNAAIMGSAYKNVNRAMTIMKILSKL